MHKANAINFVDPVAHKLLVQDGDLLRAAVTGKILILSWHKEDTYPVGGKR